MDSSKYFACSYRKRQFFNERILKHTQTIDHDNTIVKYHIRYITIFNTDVYKKKKILNSCKYLFHYVMANIPSCKKQIVPVFDFNVFDDFKSAACSGRLNILKYLIRESIDNDEDGDYSGLAHAIREKHQSVIKILIKTNIYNNLYKALYFSVVNKRLHLLKFLINHGADIHEENGYLLYLAARLGCLKIVKILIKLGARIYSGDTNAFGAAIISGHMPTIKYLSNYGGDINIDKTTLLKIARKTSYKDVIKFIKLSKFKN